ncbi:unnamed protein product [Phytophthora lilii]|uniref:Unnamed protein product n=1 Tax=Phytophthora lilii TaxID=2077276 RepID=A0A9W6TNE2_9STRA|nr:unnamed protein product [Phytophthora lilii]
MTKEPPRELLEKMAAEEIPSTYLRHDRPGLDGEQELGASWWRQVSPVDGLRGDWYHQPPGVNSDEVRRGSDPRAQWGPYDCETSLIGFPDAILTVGRVLSSHQANGGINAIFTQQSPVQHKHHFPIRLVHNQLSSKVKKTFIFIFLLSDGNSRTLSSKRLLLLTNQTNMDCGEGACSSPEHEESELFRLLRLIHEMQCEKDVVKPVLDELEVMRLCRSFGMMPAVDPNDFGFEARHAHDFDEAFTSFLQHELFENNCPGDIRPQGLFGKQERVLETLVDMKACSTKTVVSLAGSGDGIYCVKQANGGINCNGPDSEASTGLIFFSWIRDELFEPDELRDTCASVLRFLTVLTQRIVCCTSISDLERLQLAMDDYEKQQEEQLSVYSVSFCIEKQDNQQDSTECVGVGSVDVGDIMEGATTANLVKGSYPAVSIAKTIDSVIRNEPFRQTFPLNEKLSFAAWLKEESQHYRINLNGSTRRSSKLRESILREFGVWPEEQLKTSRSVYQKKRQDDLHAANQRLNDVLEQKKADVTRVSNALFRLCDREVPNETRHDALVTYDALMVWINASCRISRESQLMLEIPYRLQDIESVLFKLFIENHDVDLDRVLGMCSELDKPAILRKIAAQRASQEKRMGQDTCQTVLRGLFEQAVAAPLSTLRSKWHTAIESTIEAVRMAGLQRQKKAGNDSGSKQIIETRFRQLRETLMSKSGLLLTVTATARKGGICCNGFREVVSPPCLFHEIVKLKHERPSEAVKLEILGRHLLGHDENHLATFTIKVRSAVQICTGKERTCVKLVEFAPEDARQLSFAKETVIRTLKKLASICDFDVSKRIIIFVAEESAGVYKFDESFKHMERMKVVDLSVRSTLALTPFTDVLLLGNTLYVTDSSGLTEAIDIQNDQTSIPTSVHSTVSNISSRSRLMGFVDSLVIGAVVITTDDDSTFDGAFVSLSCGDYRRLPNLQFGMKFLTNQVHAQSIGDIMYVLDPTARQVHAFTIDVRVRSGSCRVRQCGDNDGQNSGPEVSSKPCLRMQHWMYTLFHVFEKFPIRSELDDKSPLPGSIVVACQSGTDTSAAFRCCHGFLSILMSDLMSLNKPLHGMDLTNGLTVQEKPLSSNVPSWSLRQFFQILITVLPVQICRAEFNALTSTGKSYFLNHLTGSSFAMAGNRCTDGVWMTLRIVQNLLFVVLDFEGTGSFERTDQEDVFLAVLNASVSTFTIFRMDMRIDKEIDRIFTKFQKGINLLKNDDRLFQGMLYMSVKDINPNDGHGVLSEFRGKLQTLLTANNEKNFVSEMYGGEVTVNCSPTLGTAGYYISFRHARQQIVKKQKKSGSGFENGVSFYDCIRTVLANISLFDWTSINETFQQLRMNDLQRKLPGIIRIGCLFPAESQNDENVPDSLMEMLECSKSAELTLGQLRREYPELAECWKKVDQQVSLDDISDESIDFGPSFDTNSIHSTLVTLFKHYLQLSSNGAFRKIVDSDYESFDAIMSFFICRRKAKVALWTKDFLGTEQFAEEWRKIEQKFILSFEEQWKRCIHRCSHCRLQCMRPACHRLDEDHECGLGHVCRSFCDYCTHEYEGDDEMPHCASKAGHEVCESDGICSKFVRVSTNRFKGKYNSFNFELKRMVGVRNQCATVLEPRQTQHDSIHSCERLLSNGRKTIYWCDEKCVACEYFCDKPFGHGDSHSAAHGSMKNMHFVHTVADKESIEWDNREYAAGESGVAEICSLNCSTAGRGHVHYLKCDKKDAASCSYSGEQDQRRHCQAELLKPRPIGEVDEILHTKYWETIGWEDPCLSAAEISLFAKCPYLCNSNEHKRQGKTPSGCDLPAWHAPATSVAFVEQGDFTYINGHRFACSHASSLGALHHVFVLDCSGSMRGGPWNELLKGVREYLHNRIKRGAVQDVVSVVTFGGVSRIANERAKITNAVNRVVKFGGGGTNYAKGLRPASAILSRTHVDKYKPVLIFFTDGRPGDGNKGLILAQDIQNRFAYSGLRSFVVGYGRVSELGVADLAKKLGGTAHEAMTTADVGETFRCISMSLGARAGLICNSTV